MKIFRKLYRTTAVKKTKLRKRTPEPRKDSVHKCALFSVKATSQSFGGWGRTLASGLRRWLGGRWKKPPDECVGEFSFYFKHQHCFESSYWMIFLWLLELGGGGLVEEVGQSFSPLWKTGSCLARCHVLAFGCGGQTICKITAQRTSQPQTPFQKCSHMSMPFLRV